MTTHSPLTRCALDAVGQPIDHWSPDNRTRRELRNLAAELEGADG